MKIEILQVAETKTKKRTPIKTPEDVRKVLAGEKQADRECFWVIHLNTRNGFIDKELVAMGSIDSAIVHPREVFRKAVMKSSASIITAHNHPSGDPTPSSEDLNIWKRLNEAGAILGIEVLDHLVITPNDRFYSYKANN